MIQVIETAEEMQRVADRLRSEGKKIGCVPTMGFLHEGHISLMQKAREVSDVVVISIFVNPTQFGPSEDLERYPRDLEGDLKKAEEAGVDYVYFPSNVEMYPEGYQTYITVEDVSQGLCGASRPAHFRGVATVVAKLFNIMKPHMAFFGEKDYQQLKVIERMTKDLNFDMEIVGLPTIREPDGMALSSRNAYLSDSEREQALSLSRALEHARSLAANGERRVPVLVEEAKEIINNAQGVKIDYLEIRDGQTLEEIHEIKGPARMLVAAYVGKARLIDNMSIP
jgi:pantoate--beta-alanine ligase